MDAIGRERLQDQRKESNGLRTRESDVAIVGAGIVGLFCAYFLARRGFKVVVLEGDPWQVGNQQARSDDAIVAGSLARTTVNLRLLDHGHHLG